MYVYCDTVYCVLYTDIYTVQWNPATRLPALVEGHMLMVYVHVSETKQIKLNSHIVQCRFQNLTGSRLLYLLIIADSNRHKNGKNATFRFKRETKHIRYGTMLLWRNIQHSSVS